ncbi:MAG: hypothetical protein ABIS45_00360 [Burkholderiales bacterium]
MHVPGQPYLKLFWLMVLPGLACVCMGGVVVWLDYASARSIDQRSGWLRGEGQLYEVGIRWMNARNNANYAMTARCIFRLAGHEYEGSDIAGGYSSKSPAEVRSLIAPYAREAAEYSLEDLGALNPQRTWSVAYQPVAVRYDPGDPANSQMVLDKPIATLPSATGLHAGLQGYF